MPESIAAAHGKVIPHRTARRSIHLEANFQHQPCEQDVVISAVARRLMAKHHTDGEEPDSAEFDRLRKARDAMLEEADI